MLETPHVAVGAAIATKIPNPYLAIPLAFASHFILDRIPHWNPHFYTETQKYGKPKRNSTVFAVVDEFTALTFGLLMASRVLPDHAHAATVILCCLASVAPDQIKLPYFYFKQRSGLFAKWVNFERSLQIEVPFFWGIITQIAVTAAAIYFALSR